MHEFHDKSERIAAADRVVELEADKIESAESQEALDWAAEEERKEKEAAIIKDTAATEADEKWMVDQLKNEFGEDFGDDIDASFE